MHGFKKKMCCPKFEVAWLKKWWQLERDDFKMFTFRLLLLSAEAGDDCLLCSNLSGECGGESKSHSEESR